MKTLVTIVQEKKVVVEVDGHPSILLDQPPELVMNAGPIVGESPTEYRIIDAIQKN